MTLDAMPESYLERIFCYLSEEDAKRARQVCKVFYQILKHPLSDAKDRQTQLVKNYWGLGISHKWMEGIDGCFHYLGKLVFDKGLHDPSLKEPGYFSSLKKAFYSMSSHLEEPTNATLYLRIHKLVCSHFRGEETNTVMGQEKVGVFRDIDDEIHAKFDKVYQVSEQAIKEFNAMEPSLGQFEKIPGTSSYILHYRIMTAEEVEEIFNLYIKEYYNELKQAEEALQRCSTMNKRAVIERDIKKVRAVARLHQHLEWLHPVKDGTSRTSILFLNKHLVECGFHPALLIFPHKSSTLCFEDWVKYLISGLKLWERTRNAIKEGKTPETFSSAYFST